MRIRLDYGTRGLEVEIPDRNLAGVLRQANAPAVADPERAIRNALSRPIGAAPLIELARGRRDACIVVCDVTRPVPNSLLLPPVLETLQRGGLDQDRVTILIATGTHRPNEGEEAERILGREIAGRYRVANHRCGSACEQADLGISPRGVPVKLDRAYVEADLRLTVGLIEPHFMAGFSGGRKLVMPGLAALETVQAWHSPRFLEHPKAASGVVEGNPVHEEALAIARMAPPDLILDVTLNERNEITGVFAGELEQAWLEGVSFAREQCRAILAEPADIVVTTCAGAPLDATFYQAVKGMVGALPVVKPGGAIVIASECAEGVGSDIFRKTLLETTSLPQFVRDIQRPGWQFVADQWEVEELARATRHTTVYCKADGIPSDLLARLFVTPVASVEEGVARAMDRHGPESRIAVIPKGPYVIPEIAATP